MNKKFTKSLTRPYKKMLAISPPHLKVFAVVLVIMVFSELYLNNEAVSQLIDADSSVSGVFRSMIIALFLTVIIVAFNLYGGDRCKRYYSQKRVGADADPSMLVIAITAPVVSLALVIVISYIRWSVGGGSGGEQIALSQAAGGGVAAATSSYGFSMPEVILLATVLVAAIMFSYVYSFVNTDPDDMKKSSEAAITEAMIERCLAEDDMARAEKFAEDSRKLCDQMAKGVSARAKDKIVVCLLSLCHDPAIATRVYDKAVAYGKAADRNGNAVPEQAFIGEGSDGQGRSAA